MATHRTSMAVAVVAAAACAMSIGIARADNTVVDGDVAVADDQSAQTTVNLGTICISDAPITRTTELWAKRSGSTGPGNNKWSDGAQLTASMQTHSVTTGSGTVTFVPPAGTIQLPTNWLTLANNTTSDSVFGTLTIDPGASTGAFAATVTYALSGAGTAPGGGTVLTHTSTVSYSATFSDSGACAQAPVNEVPTAPGQPVASPISPNQGGFTLSWTGSTDVEADALTYTLEGKDSAVGSTHSVIASGLTSSSHTFASGAPVEGTWTYRVKAVETVGSTTQSGPWSASSTPIVVDRSAPNPPLASADRAAEYSTASGDWWKNSVTVSFTQQGDPALPDGSSGSGVKSVTAPVTVSTTGAFTAAGKSMDNALNESTPTTFGGNVDATAPVVTLTCPAGPVLQGSTASATWTASDVGSGVAGVVSGSIPLATATVGNRSASVASGLVLDQVGLASVAQSCAYSVVYDWHGFMRPVDNPEVVNKVKAGSGIPVKFSLSSDPVLGAQGLDILAAGSPGSRQVACSTNLPVDDIEETVTAGGSSLSYDATSNQYVYVWKSDKAWSGTCRILSVKLIDGTTHSANFQFTR